MATLAGALLAALAVGSVPLASAALDGGNFNIRAVNDADPTIFGMAGMRAAVTDTGGGGETPDPEPETPKEKFVFTISTTAAGCANPVVSFAGLSNSPTITDPSGAKVALAEGNTAVAATGPWTVEGNFNKFAVGTGAASNCLLSVDQWGNTGTTDLSNGFANARNLTAVAAPPATVTNMTNLFSGATAFQQNISGWDMGEVTDISGMFQHTSYNQPLNGWNTANVTSMANLFVNNSDFNQPIGNWNVGKVRDFSAMFAGASAFNQPLASWDVSSAETTYNMFSGASAFNQPLAAWGTETSKITNMALMFNGATSFDQSLNGWTVNSVTTMQGMFSYATSFNRNLSEWQTYQVRDMREMFMGASSYRQDMRDWWYVGNVADYLQFGSGSQIISEPRWS